MIIHPIIRVGNATRIDMRVTRKITDQPQDFAGLK